MIRWERMLKRRPVDDLRPPSLPGAIDLISLFSSCADTDAGAGSFIGP